MLSEMDTESRIASISLSNIVSACCRVLHTSTSTISGRVVEERTTVGARLLQVSVSCDLSCDPAPPPPAGGVRELLGQRRDVRELVATGMRRRLATQLVVNESVRKSRTARAKDRCPTSVQSVRYGPSGSPATGQSRTTSAVSRWAGPRAHTGRTPRRSPRQSAMLSPTCDRVWAYGRLAAAATRAARRTPGR